MIYIDPFQIKEEPHDADYTPIVNVCSSNPTTTSSGFPTVLDMECKRILLGKNGRVCDKKSVNVDLL